MDQYFLILTLIGLAAFGMAWMPAITKRTGISYSIIYTVVGMLVYSLFPKHLPVPLPALHEKFTLHLAELTVIISLMGTGIKIDRPFSLRNWASPIKLIVIAMLLGIFAAAVLGYHLLGLDLASAVLLGAVLAPTDPVLASDVQVEPPNKGVKSETKFALTAEAGLNDGMAFPFTWLAIVLMLNATGGGESLTYWFAYNVLYKIATGLIIGYFLGRAVGFLLFKAAKKYDFLNTRDGFLAISLTLVVYGITELLSGYGFVAVFICAVTLRHFEKNSDYHEDLHAFTNQTERLFIAVLLLLFGGALVSGILDALTWEMALFSILFLLVIRPLSAYLSLLSSKMHLKEKLAISFFGIRGMGTVFYVAFAFSTVHFNFEEELWAVVAFTILLSVIIHGITATPVMKHLRQEIPEEKVPE